MASAEIILSGIEMVHMMRKRQARFADQLRPSIADQFEIIAVRATAHIAFAAASLSICDPTGSDQCNLVISQPCRVLHAHK